MEKHCMENPPVVAALGCRVDLLVAAGAAGDWSGRTTAASMASCSAGAATACCASAGRWSLPGGTSDAQRTERLCGSGSLVCAPLSEGLDAAGGSRPEAAAWSDAAGDVWRGGDGGDGDCSSATKGPASGMNTPSSPAFCRRID